MSLLRPRVRDDRGKRVAFQHDIRGPQPESRVASRAWNEVFWSVAGWMILSPVVAAAVAALFVEPLRPLLRRFLDDAGASLLGFAARLFVLLTAIAIPLVVAPVIVGRQMYWRGRGRRLMLGDGRCMACEYDLRTLAHEPDGCTVCPECGAAWRLQGAGTEGQGDKGTTEEEA